ncbi:MAG: efflux RND transporter periplasmic adaptor subunit [Motiliproteus sp.]
MDVSRALLGSMIIMHAGFVLAADSSEPLSGFDCLIKPHSLADVSTREQGVISELLVDRGDLINKGQIIARLDSDIEEVTVKLAKSRAELRAEISEKRKDVEFAKRELKRIKELHTKGAVSSQNLDEAATNSARAQLQLQQVLHRKKVAMIELERATRFFQRRTIKSPIDGVVVDRKISLGESVDNRPILQVAEVNPLNVEVIVPVDYFGQIRITMQAEIRPVYPGAAVHTASVTVVDRIVDPASDTFGVRLELDNPGLSIPSGVRCSVHFLSE